MTCHSAEVDLYLLLPDGQRASIRSLLADRAFMAVPFTGSPSPAELVVVIDGHETTRRRVRVAAHPFDPRDVLLSYL